MKRLLLILLVQWSMVNVQWSTAQTARYWAIGTAVPGGVQELTPFPGNQFKYTGRLIEGGTLRFCNMEEPKGLSVRFLKPSCEDAYAVTNAMSFTLVRDSTTSLWTVPLTEDVYRITIDMNAKTLTGELFRPWNELFIVGGATECGWVTYTFLPFTRDEDEVCTWDWTGELKERQEFGEPRRFKFEGQNAWEPKVLHPFTSDEDILQSTQIRTGGNADHKWSIRQEGYYHIRVDVFRETVQAEFLGAAPAESPMDASPATDLSGEEDGTIYTLSGQTVSPDSRGGMLQGGMHSRSGKLPRGIYIRGGKKIAVF